ncbi:hypothetical protein KIPB_012842, partial [Kipferlia bialata]
STIKLIRKQPTITCEDLPLLSPDFSAIETGGELEGLWKQRERDGHEGKMFMAVLATAKPIFKVLIPLLMVSMSVTWIPSLLIPDMLEEVYMVGLFDTYSVKKAVYIALGMTASYLLMGLAESSSSYIMYKAAFKTMMGSSDMLYRKILRLSEPIRQQVPYK